MPQMHFSTVFIKHWLCDIQNITISLRLLDIVFQYVTVSHCDTTGNNFIIDLFKRILKLTHTINANFSG